MLRKHLFAEKIRNANEQAASSKTKNQYFRQQRKQIDDNLFRVAERVLRRRFSSLLPIECLFHYLCTCKLARFAFLLFFHSLCGAASVFICMYLWDWGFLKRQQCYKIGSAVYLLSKWKWTFKINSYMVQIKLFVNSENKCLLHARSYRSLPRWFSKVAKICVLHTHSHRSDRLIFSLILCA